MSEKAAIANVFLPLLIPESIPDTTNSFNVTAARIELFSQRNYLNINCPIGNNIIIAMQSIDNLVSCKNKSRSFGKNMQDIKFSKSKLDRFILYENFSSAGIYYQIINFQYCFITCIQRSFAKKSANTSYKNLAAKWLGNIIISSKFETCYYICFFAFSC